MKKLLLILAISLSLVSLKAEEEAIAMGEGYGLIGFEGGGGYYTLSDRYDYYHFLKEHFARSWGYNIALFVGAQRFNGPRTSGRIMVGVRRNFIPNYGDFDNTHYYKDAKKQKKFPLGEANGWEFIAVTDFLINIQSTQQASQGLLIGMEVKFTEQQNFSKTKEKISFNDPSSFTCYASIRFGYTARINREVIELILGIPLGGMNYMHDFATLFDRKFRLYSSATTLAFSYKHLF